MRLDPLFRPESIAVIGASDKPTPGRRIIASLERIGFAGRIFPVNPNYPSVLNRPCYASPAELPEAPDIAVFRLGHERVFCAVEAAAERGMKAAVIYHGGFAEQDAEGRPPRGRRAELAGEAASALA